jgi:hypothetical protein
VTAGRQADEINETLAQEACLDWAMDTKPQAMTDIRAAPRTTVMAAGQYLLGMVHHLSTRWII